MPETIYLLHFLLFLYLCHCFVFLCAFVAVVVVAAVSAVAKAANLTACFSQQHTHTHTHFRSAQSSGAQSLPRIEAAVAAVADCQKGSHAAGKAAVAVNYCTASQLRLYLLLEHCLPPLLNLPYHFQPQQSTHTQTHRQTHRQTHSLNPSCHLAAYRRCCSVSLHSCAQ